MTAPAKLVAYLSESAERYGANVKSDRHVVAAAEKALVRRMTKDREKIEALEEALRRVLSEANHALAGRVSRVTRCETALNAIEDFASAALKVGPYKPRPRRSEVNIVDDPGPSSDRKREGAGE